MTPTINDEEWNHSISYIIHLINWYSVFKYIGYMIPLNCEISWLQLRKWSWTLELYLSKKMTCKIEMFHADGTAFTTFLFVLFNGSELWSSLNTQNLRTPTLHVFRWVKRWVQSIHSVPALPYVYPVFIITKLLT